MWGGGRSKNVKIKTPNKETRLEDQSKEGVRKHVCEPWHS